MTTYAEWAERQRAGMESSKPYTELRRLRGEALARRRREMNERYPCGIKGCAHTAYKGKLCRKHWALVPLDAKVELQVAALTAQMRVTRRYHAKFLRDVQSALR